MNRLDFAIGLLSGLLAINRDKATPGRLPVQPSLVILLLSRQPGRWFSSSEIIAELGINSGSLAMLLGPAVRSEYMHRQVGANGRHFEYQLAEKGRLLAINLLNPETATANA